MEKKDLKKLVQIAYINGASDAFGELKDHIAELVGMNDMADKATEYSIGVDFNQYTRDASKSILNDDGNIEIVKDSISSDTVGHGSQANVRVIEIDLGDNAWTIYLEGVDYSAEDDIKHIPMDQLRKALDYLEVMNAGAK